MASFLKRLKWKKILTREYSFLYASYAADAFKVMKKEVGTTLEYDFFYGEGKLLTIYRIEKDIKNSYKMIEKIAKSNPNEIVKKMDKFDELVKKNYELFGLIRKTKDKNEIKKFLIELDETFLLTLCYYLFFVYLGYAGNLPSISKFLKKSGKRFSKIRTYTIDTDMNREYPVLFGNYDTRLKKLTSYMTRKELITAVKGKAIDIQKILNRKKRYLLIMKKHKIKEVNFLHIDNVVKKELSHLQSVLPQNIIRGQTACRGKVLGKVKIIFTSNDYKKIRRGDVIVTPMTKPTIVPFLTEVRGIITNDGGVLSHASVISREMNIPCIVGTDYATNILKDGDTVELDATHGVVKKIIKTV